MSTDESNVEITATALAGLNAAENQVNRTAARLSRVGLPGTDNASDTVDLSTEVVNLLSAKQDFEVNLKSLETGDQMTKEALSILG